MPILKVPTFIKSVGFLSGGTLFGQLVVVAVSPVLTRVYSPAEIGIYGIYSTVLMIGLVASSLRLESAIPLTRSVLESYHLSLICLLLTAFVAGIIAAASLLFPKGLLAGQVTYNWIPWVAGGVLFGGAYQVFAAICVKNGRYLELSLSRALQGTVLSAAQILFGVFGLGYAGLLCGDIIGRTVSVLPTMRGVWSALSSATREATYTTSCELFRRYLVYPALLFPGAIVNLLASQFIVLVGPRYFSLAEAGAYFLAYRALFLPGTLLAGAVNQVFLGRIAGEITSEVKQAFSTYSVILGLLTIATPLYLGIALHGIRLFPWVFGPEWELSGAYAFLISPLVIVWLPATATSAILLVKRKFLASLLINVAHFLLIATGFMLAVMRSDYFFGVFLTSLFGGALYGFGVIWFSVLSGVKVKNLMRSYIRCSLYYNVPYFALQLIINEISSVLSIVFWISMLAPVWVLSVKRVRSELLALYATTFSQQK
jgi:O-antigen/teichoic acid export membrane protein